MHNNNVSIAVMINFCRLHFETTFRYTINYNYLYFKTINNLLNLFIVLNKFLLFVDVNELIAMSVK